MERSMVAAAGLGAVSGLRTLQGVAWLSRSLSDGRPPRWATPPERWLSHRTVARTLSVLAAGELTGDKLPFAPARVRPGPLMGRAVVGGGVGAVAAGRDRAAAGAMVGASAAVLAAFGGWFLRREAGRRTALPDPILALLEDAAAVALARRLTTSR